MMRGLIRWLRSWRRVWRYRARKHDAEFMFPAVWATTRPDWRRFVWAVSVHTASDPNWAGHEDEWSHSPVDPATWLTDQCMREAGL